MTVLSGAQLTAYRLAGKAVAYRELGVPFRYLDVHKVTTNGRGLIRAHKTISRPASARTFVEGAGEAAVSMALGRRASGESVELLMWQWQSVEGVVRALLAGSGRITYQEARWAMQER